MSRLILITLAMLLIATSGWAATLPPAVRGDRTVYLDVEPGTLEITVLKRDLNIYDREDLLHLTLFDPLSNEVFQHTMPDDGTVGRGRAEEYQRFDVNVDVEFGGVYRLLVHGSSDLVWGVETSAERLVVQGGLLLSDFDISGSIYFPPPNEEFAITIAALHDPGRQTVPLYDADGEKLHDFELTVTGEDHLLEFPAEERDGLWRLDMEAMSVRLSIDGVQYWTSEEDAWFDVSKSRWMLLPYRTTRYLQAGEAATVDLTLRNSTGDSDRFHVEATADPEVAVDVIEPEMPVALAADETATIRVRATLADPPAEETELHVLLRATAEDEPNAQATSGINVRVGESPVSEPLEMPITLRPFAHEAVQFGYDPDYVRNEVYFDEGNLPWIRHRTEDRDETTGVYSLDEDRRWTHHGFEDAIRRQWPDYVRPDRGAGFIGAKLAFDGQGGVYTTLRLIAGAERPAVLLFSPDEGESWEVHEVRGNVAEIEQFTGHNRLDGPPPVLTFERTGPHPARWASYHDLWLYLPQREGDTLVLGEPIRVAEAVIGSCQHSGGPSSTVTADGSTHIVWGEISGEPDGTGADERGVPTYAATYDHTTEELSEKILLGHGPPVNDVHNVPAITIDSQGILHVLIGAHGRPFHYVHSLRPNDAGEWTEAEPILTTGFTTDDGDEVGRQTYISLVCDADDTLHTAFRQWRNQDPYHDGELYAALSWQQRPRDGEWTEEATPLVIPPLPGYSIYYHKLTIDRLGDLWLSYSYLTSNQTYQGQFPHQYHHRAVIVSRDGGETWKLAESDDFFEGIDLHQ